MTQQVDGHEAYRDDAEYTAPEMEPGKGEENSPEASAEGPFAAAAGLTIGSAGGAFAGEMLIEDEEQLHEDQTPRRDV